MKRGKYSKKREFKHYNKKLPIIILLLVFIILGIYIMLKENTIIEKESISIAIEEKTVENKKLVLKSNYEENREKKLIFIFNKGILDKVEVIEKYNEQSDYNSHKEEYKELDNIEIIECDDEELLIYYKEIDISAEKKLSYKDVYNQYMGIIGAYEEIK